MPSFFHPHLQQGRQVAANRLRNLATHWPQTLFHAAGAALVLAIVAAGVGRIDGDRIGLVLRLLAAQPLLLVLAFGAFGFFMCRSSTLGLVTELRLGWWGAMPVPPAATRRSLRLNALLQTVFATLIVLGVLLLIVWLSRRPTPWFPTVAGVSTAALWLGSALGYFGAHRIQQAPPPKQAQDHSSAALLPLAALDHPQLHNIPEWQRRETVRRWRSGGRRWQLLALGLLIPMGMPVVPLLGLVLLGVSLIWYGLALRASEDSIVGAERLLAALPLPFPRFAAATLRYPVFAWCCAAALGAAGLLLQSARPLVALLFALLLAMASALSLSLTWRYRRRPWLARTRASAEVLLTLLLAWQLPPLAPVFAAALVARHYLVARSLV
jgi:hypothetical protein